MNLKHLRNASATIGLLGSLLLPVTPVNAGPFLGSAKNFGQQENIEPWPMSITFTGWPLHVFLGGTAGLLTLSTMLLIDRIKRDKADKLQQQLKVPSNKHYIKAIESGDNFDNWLKLGTTLASQEKHEEAIECFDRAIKHEPFAADAWKGFGDSMFALRRFQEAFDAYNIQLQAIKYCSNQQVKPVTTSNDKLLKINEAIMPR
jgi:tetratricopeptide (TPR) repeat protein